MNKKQKPWIDFYVEKQEALNQFETKNKKLLEEYETLKTSLKDLEKVKEKQLLDNGVEKENIVKDGVLYKVSIKKRKTTSYVVDNIRDVNPQLIIRFADRLSAKLIKTATNDELEQLNEYKTEKTSYSGVKVVKEGEINE